MKKLTAGLILILMMLGHNYVINQPQSLQKQIETIHKVSVTQFNLLYSIPSFLTLLTVIPIGIMYHKYPNFTLLFGVFILFCGQLLVSLFCSQGKPYYFSILIAGRAFQGTGAEILYMIQGNLASSWMSNLAGLIFILPQVGQIMNAFFTPFAAIKWGVQYSLCIGLIFCFISVIACCYLYCYLKKIQKIKKQTEKVNMIEATTPESQLELQNTTTQQQYGSYHDDDKKNNININLKTKSINVKNFQQIQQKQKFDSDDQITIRQKHQIAQPKNILNAGLIFWLTIVICAINQCLYFPFLDNANQLIQMRFKIPYEDTGYYLCLPFLAASNLFLYGLVLTTIVMSRLLIYFERKDLIFYTSFLPSLGHFIILALPNSDQETITIAHKFILGLGFFVFGTGIGGYYSVSFPAVGLAVPSQIRGLAYGILCFFQTLAMSLIPILSGFIIQDNPLDQINGYRNNSIMFVFLTFIGILIAYNIKRFANSTSFMYDDQESNSQQNLGFIQASNSANNQKRTSLNELKSSYERNNNQKRIVS